MTLDIDFALLVLRRSVTKANQQCYHGIRAALIPWWHGATYTSLKNQSSLIRRRRLTFFYLRVNCWCNCNWYQQTRKRQYRKNKQMAQLWPLPKRQNHTPTRCNYEPETATTACTDVQKLNNLTGNLQLKKQKKNSKPP